MTAPAAPDYSIQKQLLNPTPALTPLGVRARSVSRSLSRALRLSTGGGR